MILLNEDGSGSFRPSRTTTLLLVLHVLLCSLVRSNICFVYYEVADNNLEYALRKDLEEYMNSSAIENPSVTSWVYFDGRNLNGTYEDIIGPLPHIFQTNGMPIVEKYEGSLYLTFNHSTSEMVVDTMLPGEQNSDTPQTVVAFLTKAFSDCVSKGSTQYLVIFSSHGAGFAGFGGDENIQRRLQQSNQNLSNAIDTALHSVAGAPSKVNVIGFDACLMSDFGALDDYSKVADYVLASESVVPGHGFAYYTLDYATTALDMAKGLALSFLTETQDGENSPLTTGHQTPKTIAIINTTGYTEFLAAWEVLSSDLTNRLTAANDPTLVKILTRTRIQTLSFEGVIDTPGTWIPSSMDIGQFFVDFGSFCNIDPESSLKTSLDAAQNAYKAMFVVQGDGPGTVNGTGMTILWPLPVNYKMDPTFYDNILFNSSSPYATVAAPNWLMFLQTYYATGIPQRSTTTSVCLNSIDNSIQPDYADQLLLSPSLKLSSTSANFTSEVTFETDYVKVQYGVNISHYISTHDAAITKSNQKSRVRQDSYFLFGGTAFVEYGLKTVQAIWDRKFYYLRTNNSPMLTPIYVIDKGNGQKAFPVCYFYPGSNVTAEDLTYFSTYDLASLFLGCIWGQVAFSEESEAWTLYILTDGETLSPISIQYGGQIAPIAYGVFPSNQLEIVGSFPLTTLLDWNPLTNISMVSYDDDKNLDIFGEKTTGFIYTRAYDFDRYIYDNTTGMDTDLQTYNLKSSQILVGESDVNGHSSGNGIPQNTTITGNQQSFTSNGLTLRFGFDHFAVYPAITLFLYWCLIECGNS